MLLASQLSALGHGARLVLIQRNGVGDLLSLGDAVPQEGLETSAGAAEMERGDGRRRIFSGTTPRHLGNLMGKMSDFLVVWNMSFIFPYTGNHHPN